MKVKIKRLDKELPLPKYESEGAAGIDLYSAENIDIVSEVATVVGTGISIELEPGYEAQIRPRSGLAAKFGIMVINSPGTIDSDYRGEIKVILQLASITNEYYKINRGDRIAQMVIKPAPQAEIQEVLETEETERGDKGFGSTGQ